jgi:hypothetical protein
MLSAAIINALEMHGGQPVCDDCLSAEVGSDCNSVQSITQMLARTPNYAHADSGCILCGERGSSIRYIDEQNVWDTIPASARHGFSSQSRS